MLSQKYLEDIQQRKNALKFSIERQRAAIEAFDQRSSKDEDLGDDEFAQYNVYTDELAKMKKQLEELRLEPDSFQLARNGQKIILEISEKGEMAFIRVVPTEEPVIPPQMSSYALCRIEITENGYEVRYAEKIRYIDELKLITIKTAEESSRPILNRTSTLRALQWTNSVSSRFNTFIDNVRVTNASNSNNAPGPTSLKRSNSERIPKDSSIRSQTLSAPNSPSPNLRASSPPVASGPTAGGVKLDWKDGSSDMFMADEGNSLELTEVVGCHMNRYKRAKVKHVNRLKEIFRLKSTTYDSSNESHEELLLKFWTLAYPHRTLNSRKSHAWKELGFQGTDPATDFRGMGLLGLHNLIYFAARYPEKVALILEKKRDYPFAVTGINITNMLLEMMNISKAGASKEGPTSPLWDTPLLVFFCMAEENKDKTVTSTSPSNSPIFTNMPTTSQNTSSIDNGEFAFEEVYCMCYEVFDGIWAMMDAKYMDFPKVMTRVKQLVIRVSEGRPTDWGDFRNRVDQLVISSELDTPPSTATNGANDRDLARS